MRCVYDRCKTWLLWCNSLISCPVILVLFRWITLWYSVDSSRVNQVMPDCITVLLWVWNVVLDLCQCSMPYSLRTTTSHSPHYSTCEAALYWNSSSFSSSFLLQISESNSAPTTYIQSIEATLVSDKETPAIIIYFGYTTQISILILAVII